MDPFDAARKVWPWRGWFQRPDIIMGQGRTLGWTPRQAGEMAEGLDAEWADDPDLLDDEPWSPPDDFTVGLKQIAALNHVTYVTARGWNARGHKQTHKQLPRRKHNKWTLGDLREAGMAVRHSHPPAGLPQPRPAQAGC